MACRVSLPAAASWASSGWRTDISDRRQLEQRLVRAERAQAIGQLAGGVAHDFNNLLTGIIGHVGLLQEEPGLSDTAREDLAQIQRSADRAASLTRQLLALTRRQVLSPRVLDLNEVVAGCLSTLRRLVGERIQVVSVPAGSLDTIVADPNQLEQILSQLSAYARDSMPNGGTLELSTRQERLEMVETGRLQGLRSGSYVVLQVRDTGPGMDPADARTDLRAVLRAGACGRRVGARARLGLRHRQAERRTHRRRERAGRGHFVHDLLPPPRGQRAGRRRRARRPPAAPRRSCSSKTRSRSATSPAGSSSGSATPC